VEVAGTEKGAAYDASLLRGLLDRGLKGVRLVVSDEHEGIKSAVAGEQPGVGWQRCVVHFERNVLAHVAASSMAEAAQDIKAVLKVRRQKTAEASAEEFISRALREELPQSRLSLRGGDRGRPDLSMATREARIRTTNMLEGLFKEVKRRTRVVGVFPNETSAATLAMEEIALRSSEESGR